LENGWSGGAAMFGADADESQPSFVALVGFEVVDGAATGTASFALPLSDRF
jgi:hypothetical protein